MSLLFLTWLTFCRVAYASFQTGVSFSKMTSDTVIKRDMMLHSPSSYLNQSLQYTIGKSPYQLHCFGMMAMMSIRSHYVHYLQQRFESKAFEYECLHLLKEFEFNTPEKIKAFQYVWNVMNGMRKTNIYNIPPINLTRKRKSHSDKKEEPKMYSYMQPNEWDREFEAFKEMRVYFEYFQVRSTTEISRRLFVELCSICPYQQSNPNIEDQLKRTKQREIHEYVVKTIAKTMEKQEWNKDRRVFVRASKFISGQCAVSEDCCNEIELSERKHWESVNGMVLRLNMFDHGQRYMRLKQWQKCELHKHTLLLPMPSLQRRIALFFGPKFRNVVKEQKESVAEYTFYAEEGTQLICKVHCTKDNQKKSLALYSANVTDFKWFSEMLDPHAKLSGFLEESKWSTDIKEGLKEAIQVNWRVVKMEDHTVCGVLDRPASMNLPDLFNSNNADMDVVAVNNATASHSNQMQM